MRNIETTIQVGTDPRLRNPIIMKYLNIRLDFMRFLLNKDTKDMIKNSIEPFLPFSLLVIGSGSDFPRNLNICHPLHKSRISISCLSFNESINFDSYNTLNYNFNPSTKILSIFLLDHVERKVYVASTYSIDSYTGMIIFASNITSNCD